MDNIVHYLDKEEPIGFILDGMSDKGFTCPECGAKVNFLELTDNGRFLCEECNLRMCPICGDYHHPDRFVSYKGYSYCGNWYCRNDIDQLVRIMEH